jgi:hypothetical protein
LRGTLPTDLRLLGPELTLQMPELKIVSEGHTIKFRSLAAKFVFLDQGTLYCRIDTDEMVNETLRFVNVDKKFFHYNEI